jgi:uncharacterized protein with HEPN domain
MRDDIARVLDINLACADVLSMTAGVDRKAYNEDRTLQFALCRVLEVIGEAARNISEDYRLAHPQVPWAKIIGLRNKIAHEYFRLDLDMIWRIVTEDVPALAKATASLVPPEEET